MRETIGNVIRAKIIDCGLASEATVVGCNAEEIETIKISQEVDFLPQTYTQFLSIIGHGAGELFQGSNYECNTLIRLKRSFLETLEMLNLSYRPPTDAFVFLAHQGTIFWFFHTKNRDEDPAVYRYFEGDEDAILVQDHFSAFILEAIESYCSGSWI